MKGLFGIATDADEDIFLAHTEDMLRQCERDRCPKYTGFLDERRIMLADVLLKSKAYPYYRFFGGYAEAERRILSVFPEYAAPADEDYPIEALRFSFRKQDKLTHPQLLGTIMSLGIKRELVGDMIIGETAADVIFCPSGASAAEGISKAGRTGVKVTRIDPASVKREENFEEIRASVSSLRLDCVVSAAIHLSRDRTAALIKSEGAEVNHIRIFSPAHNITAGDVFSVRGKGKFILSETGGESRRGKIFIGLKKYK